MKHPDSQPKTYEELVRTHRRRRAAAVVAGLGIPFMAGVLPSKASGAPSRGTSVELAGAADKGMGASKETILTPDILRARIQKGLSAQAQEIVKLYKEGDKKVKFYHIKDVPPNAIPGETSIYKYIDLYILSVPAGEQKITEGSKSVTLKKYNEYRVQFGNGLTDPRPLTSMQVTYGMIYPPNKNPLYSTMADGGTTYLAFLPNANSGDVVYETGWGTMHYENTKTNFDVKETDTASYVLSQKNGPQKEKGSNVGLGQAQQATNLTPASLTEVWNGFQRYLSVGEQFIQNNSQITS